MYDRVYVPTLALHGKPICPHPQKLLVSWLPGGGTHDIGRVYCVLACLSFSLGELASYSLHTNKNSIIHASTQAKNNLFFGLR